MCRPGSGGGGGGGGEPPSGPAPGNEWIAWPRPEQEIPDSVIEKWLKGGYKFLGLFHRGMTPFHVNDPSRHTRDCRWVAFLRRLRLA
jgi:hypothetical protein